MSHHYVHDDPRTWYTFDPKIIAHDVGHTRDRSTAVVGGNSYAKPRRLGILELHELPLGLYGSQRASALRQIDCCHGNNALIVADLSNDASYAENLFEAFRSRLIGLRITRHGEGMERQWRQVLDGFVPVYTVGRSHLFELYLAELHSRLVKIVDSPMARKAHSQLEALEVEYRETGTVYGCLPGHHDDLGISCAMLAWAARHPHLPYWVRTAAPVHRPSRPQMTAAQVWRACT